MGVITISRGCFERCCNNKNTLPYHSNLGFGLTRCFQACFALTSSCTLRRSHRLSMRSTSRVNPLTLTINRVRVQGSGLGLGLGLGLGVHPRLLVLVGRPIALRQTTVRCDGRIGCPRVPPQGTRQPHLLPAAPGHVHGGENDLCKGKTCM